MTNILLASNGFGIGEIVLIVACALFVVGVAVVAVVRKKKGKSSCDCGGCAHCAGCNACKTVLKDEKNTDKLPSKP